jgi:hypothetical protein
LNVAGSPAGTSHDTPLGCTDLSDCVTPPTVSVNKTPLATSGRPNEVQPSEADAHADAHPTCTVSPARALLGEIAMRQPGTDDGAAQLLGSVHAPFAMPHW